MRKFATKVKDHIITKVMVVKSILKSQSAEGFVDTAIFSSVHNHDINSHD
jgi:hypothetical protein